MVSSYNNGEGGCSLNAALTTDRFQTETHTLIVQSSINKLDTLQCVCRNKILSARECLPLGLLGNQTETNPHSFIVQ
ncbi:hypothetical protein PAMP_009368 [Pampus punctatissimus]